MYTPVDMRDEHTENGKGIRFEEEPYQSLFASQVGVLCTFTAVHSPLDTEDGKQYS